MKRMTQVCACCLAWAPGVMLGTTAMADALPESAPAPLQVRWSAPERAHPAADPSAVALASAESAGPATVAGPVPSPSARPASLPGLRPMASGELARRRGGSSDVFNDMQLKGLVSDNRAVNVSTGANWVTEGSLAGAVGIPMLVQNTGNNVLIQNATIINLQLK